MYFSGHEAIAVSLKACGMPRQGLWSDAGVRCSVAVDLWLEWSILGDAQVF